MALMIGIDALMLVWIRYYARTGKIWATPFAISRERTPRWFAINMTVLWLSFALALIFTVVISTALILGQ